MPDITAITIADATPANHVFTPITKALDGALFKNRESVTAAGQMDIILAMSLASSKRATNRVDVRFNHPFEVTADGITTVRDIARYSGQYVLPQGMTAADRARFAAMVSNLVASAIVNAYVEDLDPAY